MASDFSDSTVEAAKARETTIEMTEAGVAWEHWKRFRDVIKSKRACAPALTEKQNKNFKDYCLNWISNIKLDMKTIERREGGSLWGFPAVSSSRFVSVGFLFPFFFFFTDGWLYVCATVKTWLESKMKSCFLMQKLTGNIMSGCVYKLAPGLLR